MNEVVALYARVSSEKQAHEGTIDSQVIALREYAKEHNYCVDEDLVFIDNGVSGSSLIRPALDALRDKASSGSFKKMIVLCPDRLARKHAHQLVVTEELHRLGVEIIFVNRSISSSPEDQLLFQIQGVIAEYEREKILERNRRGKIHKARNGKVTVFANAPYGYVYTPKKEGNEAQLQIHPMEAEVVRQIYRCFLDQRMSLRGIARQLSEQGICTRQHAPSWAPGVIHGILKNPVYSGTAAYQKKKHVPARRPNRISFQKQQYPKRASSSNYRRPKEDWIMVPTPAIITKSEYDRVQAQFDDNKRFSPRNQKNHYLLTSLLRCKECGYSMYGKLSTIRTMPTKFHYYRCVGLDAHRWHDRSKRCHGHPIKIEVLDDLVWKKVTQLLQQPETILDEYTNRLSKKEKITHSLDELLRKKRQELHQQNTEKERILDLFQSGLLSKKEIESRLIVIRQKIKAIEQECLAFEKDKLANVQRLTLVNHLEVFKKQLASNIDQLSFEQKKKIVQLLISEIIIDQEKDTVTIYHCIPAAPISPLCLPHPFKTFCLH